MCKLFRIFTLPTRRTSVNGLNAYDRALFVRSQVPQFRT